MAPDPVEHGLEGLFGRGVAVLALELFEVERAGGLEPDFDLLVVFGQSLLGLKLLLLLLFFFAWSLGFLWFFLFLLLFGLLFLSIILFLSFLLLFLCESRFVDRSAPLEISPNLLALGEGCQRSEPSGQVRGLGEVSLGQTQGEQLEEERAQAKICDRVELAAGEETVLLKLLVEHLQQLFGFSLRIVPLGLVSLQVAEHDLQPREQGRLQLGLGPVEPGVHLSLLLVVGAVEVEVALGDAGEVSADGVRSGNDLSVFQLESGIDVQRTLVLQFVQFRF